MAAVGQRAWRRCSVQEMECRAGVGRGDVLAPALKLKPGAFGFMAAVSCSGRTRTHLELRGLLLYTGCRPEGGKHL